MTSSPAYGPSDARPNSVHRRTLVAGAAWSIPVVAMATATPAAAASLAPTLAFTQGSYTGAACKTITGVQVRRTSDGTTPDPGKQITVTLADGYTFAGGATTYTGSTDANGLVTLPDITVPARGGNSAFTATSDSLVADAGVSSPAAGVAYRMDGDGNLSTFPAVPAGSEAIGDRFYLAPNGDLYKENALFTTGASNASWTYNRFSGVPGYSIVTYVKGDRGYRVDNEGNGSESTSAGYSLPAGSTAIGDAVYAAPNGDVYQDGNVVITGTTSVHEYFNQTSSGTAFQHIYTYMKDGVAYRRDGDGNLSTYTSVPAGSTPVGDSTFLTPNGDLYNKNTVVASGVRSASWTYNIYGGVAGYSIYTYVTDAGGFRLDNEGNLSTYAAVPSDSTAIGDGVYRAANGDVYEGNTVHLAATTSAVEYFNQTSSATAFQNIYTYLQPASCS